jgi:predicted transcriptional regulator
MVQYTVRIDDDLAEELQMLARLSGRSVAAEMNVALKMYTARVMSDPEVKARLLAELDRMRNLILLEDEDF